MEVGNTKYFTGRDKTPPRAHKAHEVVTGKLFCLDVCFQLLLHLIEGINKANSSSAESINCSSDRYIDMIDLRSFTERLHCLGATEGYRTYHIDAFRNSVVA